MPEERPRTEAARGGPDWWPAPEECDEDLYAFEPTPTGRLLVRHRCFGTRVVEFALVQQELEDGAWHVVVRVDTKHDTVHVHRFDRSGAEVGKTVLVRIERMEDVEAGYEVAERIVYDGWAENVRRWRHGR